MENNDKKFKEKLINNYVDYVLTNGKDPVNVYVFTKAHNFYEADFYAHFASFDSLKKNILASLITKTISILDKNDVYKEYDTTNKLLSFYYTFFELSTKNRSIIMHIADTTNQKQFGLITELKQEFTTYLDSLRLKTVNFNQEKLDKLGKKSTKEFYWMQFIFIFKFWKSDQSANFEKTDLLIEKLITTGVEISNTAPLDSIMDLGKFLFKELNPQH